MPPRRSARLAAAAELATSVLPPLPLALSEHIFLLLPADRRAQAACVCRAWRDALADPALWTRLDLSRCEGRGSDPDALLQGAAARARGQLSRLDVSGALRFTPRVLLAVVEANAGHLRELRVGGANAIDELSANPSVPAFLDALLAAAPLLQVLDACVSCKAKRAIQLMNAEKPLQLHKLQVQMGNCPNVFSGTVLSLFDTSVLRRTPKRLFDLLDLLMFVKYQPGLLEVEFSGTDTLHGQPTEWTCLRVRSHWRYRRRRPKWRHWRSGSPAAL